MKNFFISFLTFLGMLKNAFYPKKKNKIFIFHEIEKKNYKKFYKVIKYIQSKYEIINPEKKFNTDGKVSQAIITFDDGFLSQYECTKKYLDKENIKAIFFVIYDFMNINSKKKHREFLLKNLKIKPQYINNKEFKNMNFRNFQSLIKNGHTIGSHTLSHPNLKKICKEKCKIEILKSKVSISKKLGVKKINNFAITFGGINYFNPYVLKLCKKYYKSTHTGIRGSNNNSHRVFFRENCDLNKDFKEIKFLIDGYADLYYVFDRIKLKFYNFISHKC
ncbi:polysaccharide deacetylase family protein [Candidatus Pelagibacter sp. HIMB1715]|uniref:polysaccharide deacetylase family protein n=1 Tax=Candidatus Pelagibacter sp. HIMB1715 TaxID=3413369 RepID=UPI003F8664EB